MSSAASDRESRLMLLAQSVAVLEQIAKSLKETTDRIEARLDLMDSRIERRFDLMDTRLTAIQSEQRSDFRWLLGAGLAGFSAILGILGHSLHWF